MDCVAFMFSSFCVFKVNLPPQIMMTYTERGDGFNSVFTALCEACHFQIQPRHETCLKKKISHPQKHQIHQILKPAFIPLPLCMTDMWLTSTAVFLDSCFLLVLILLLMFCVVQKTSVRRLNLRMSCELLCCSVLLGIKPSLKPTQISQQ